MGVVLRILAEGYQACEGGYQRAHAADVHSHQKVGIIGGELREEYRRGDVRDALAGYDAEQKRVLFKEPREKFPNRIYPRHVAGKDKEKHKRQQQRVVYLFQRLSVGAQKRQRYDYKPYPVGNEPKYNNYRESEEEHIKHRSPQGELHAFVLERYRLGPDENEAAGGYQRDGKQKRRRHYLHEFKGGNGEFCVEIEILRVAERREHSAQIRGDVLHYKGERHIFSLARRGQHKIPERQKGQKRHVVGYQHRADEGDVNKRKNAKPRVFEALDDLLRKNIKEIDIFKRADYRQHAEKTGKRLKIEITDIIRVGRNYHGGDGGGAKRNHHYRVLFDKRPDAR